MCPLIPFPNGTAFRQTCGFLCGLAQGPQFPLNPLDWFNYVVYILFHCLVVPVRSPYIDDYRAIDYSKIWIRWEKLSPKYVRGILRGYRIYYSIPARSRRYEYGTPVGNITVGPDIQEMTITGLRPNTYYVVWVKAFTSRGEGSRKNTKYIKTSHFFAAGNCTMKIISVSRMSIFLCIYVDKVYIYT